MGVLLGDSKRTENKGVDISWMGFYGGCYYVDKRYARIGWVSYTFWVGPTLTNPHLMYIEIIVWLGHEGGVVNVGAAATNHEDISLSH